MENRGQLALPVEKLDLAIFPAKEDAGDRRAIDAARAIALITWAKGYGLDPWQGHVVYYFGKPYVTEKGAVTNARNYPDYSGFTLINVPPEDREARGFDRDGYVYECTIWIKGRDLPLVEYGEVGTEEIDKCRAAYGDKAQFLPVVNFPGKIARSRAIRRAHLLAFPLKKVEHDKDTA